MSEHAAQLNDLAGRLAKLDAERSSILAQIRGVVAKMTETATPTSYRVHRGRRLGSKMSAEARARISEAQKARWAKYHAKKKKG
jgi:hypothetical protein